MVWSASEIRPAASVDAHKSQNENSTRVWPPQAVKAVGLPG